MASLRVGTHHLSTGWGKAVLTALLALAVTLTPAGRWIELQLSDLREQAWPAPTELAPVTVLAIDEATLDAVGPWPWSRDQWQRVIKGVYDHYSPLVLALDLVLPPGASPQADLRLGQAMGQYPIVLGQLVLPTGTLTGLWKGQVFEAELEPFVPVGLAQAGGALANSPPLAGNAAVGHINALLDADGVLRRYVPVVCWHTECSVSLGMATVGRAFGASAWQLAQEPAGGVRLSLHGLEHLSVPLFPQGGFQVPWQRYRAIPVASLRDVTQGRVDPKMIDNRLLLVGTTASGFADHVVTPVLTQMPGVMTHAVIASSIIESRLPQQPSWAWAASAMLYAALAAGVLARPWRYWQQAGVVALCMAALAAVLLPAYHRYDLIIPATFPVLGLLLLTTVQLAQRLRLANQDLILRLTAYLPRPLVRGLAHHAVPPPHLAWSTLLCADTVAYTAASQILPPDQLAVWVNTGLDIVIRLIERHGGVVDNVAGDGLMAYWDQGSAREQANEALKTAMAVCRAMQRASADLQTRGLPALDMGIGLHAGPLLAGSYGAGQQRRYTVHGEAANLAQRIEKATRLSPYRLLMSQNLAFIQTRYHPVSADFHLTVGKASFHLYTVTRPIPQRAA